ncbi:FecR family protein [Arsenicibacter rosenii]|nr:FecR domain-containing protein [Arsenicibacter rosenii]
MKPEQLITDDTFLAWYFQTDDACVSKWDKLIRDDLDLKAAADEAVVLLNLIHQQEYGQVSDRQIDQSMQRLRHRIGEWEKAQQPRPVFRMSYRRAWQLAACLILIGFGVFRAGQYNQPHHSYVADDKRTDIILADGTTVTLNKGAGIKVAGMEAGETADREVWLEGEAFFDVKHLTGHRKFIVHSGEVDVVVLGTRFNVKNGPQQTAVALESGRVELSVAGDKAGKLIMQPGELIEYSRQSGRLARSAINVKNYAAWQQGSIVFENADAAVLQQVLRERFNLNVDIGEGAGLGEFNGVFPADDPALLINALEKTYPGQVVRTEGGLKFVKAGQP